VMESMLARMDVFMRSLHFLSEGCRARMSGPKVAISGMRMAARGLDDPSAGASLERTWALVVMRTLASNGAKRLPLMEPMICLLLKSLMTFTLTGVEGAPRCEVMTASVVMALAETERFISRICAPLRMNSCTISVSRGRVPAVTRWTYFKVLAPMVADPERVA